MSILNVQVLADRVLLAVDTKMATGSVLGETTKFQIIEPAHAVLAGRGVAAFQFLLFAALSASGGSVDELVRVMMKQIESCMEYMRLDAERMQSTDPMLSEGQDITLVGWSESHQRLLAIRWYKPAGKLRFEADVLSGWSIGPSMSRDDLRQIQGPLDSECKMIEVMNRQIYHFERSYPGLPIGGRPIFIDVTKERIAVTRGAPFAGMLP
ncbi:hypothetical protein [Pseudoduganella sp. OTU4001]|uniref:hypothetical protein n=1 Tax=Pseudoduganella sp. OTU4001 TaxID=3043854 RepID=UPI00313DCF56